MNTIERSPPIKSEKAASRIDIVLKTRSTGAKWWPIKSKVDEKKLEEKKGS